MPLKVRLANSSVGMPGMASRCLTGSSGRKAAGFAALAAPLSQCTEGSRTIAKAEPMAASSTAAVRHPECDTRIGTSAPATTPPSGTPVCLIDITRPAVRAVVRGPSICELAGFIAAVRSRWRPTPMPRRRHRAAAGATARRQPITTLARLSPIPPIRKSSAGTVEADQKGRDINDDRVERDDSRIPSSLGCDRWRQHRNARREQ